MSYVHIQIHPRTFSLDELKLALSRDWADAALRVWNFVATYHEKNRTERLWSQRAMKLVEDAAPESFKTGVHLLDPGGGFMGEDVFFVDGTLHNTLHLRHTVCGSAVLLRRKDGLWCVTCDKIAEELEIK